jgi:hypothetical protein
LWKKRLERRKLFQAGKKSISGLKTIYANQVFSSSPQFCRNVRNAFKRIFQHMFWVAPRSLTHGQGDQMSLCENIAQNVAQPVFGQN